MAPGEAYRLDMDLFPRLWSIAPGHALRLTLTTDATYFGSEPCLLTEAQTRTLPGGRKDRTLAYE